MQPEKDFEQDLAIAAGDFDGPNVPNDLMDGEE